MLLDRAARRQAGGTPVGRGAVDAQPADQVQVERNAVIAKRVVALGQGMGHVTPPARTAPRRRPAPAGPDAVLRSGRYRRNSPAPRPIHRAPPGRSTAPAHILLYGRSRGS